MSALEIIALVVIGLALLELVICLVDPKLLLKVSKPLYTRPVLARIIYLFAGALVFYFLIQELSVVQIMATIVFAGCLIGVGIAPIGRELLDIVSKQIFEGRFWRDYALVWIVWIILIIWTLLEIFS